MQPLYHYTDLNAFLSIIKFKQLWLSGAHNLNDHQEINWTNRKVAKILGRLEDKYGAQNTRRLLDLMQMNKAVPYICSLSTKDDLLSQWRAYGKDGTGVAIGFNSDLLPSSKRLPVLTTAPKDSITTLPVLYSEAEQDATIENIVVYCMEALQNAGEDAVETEIHAAITLNGLSTVFKNEAFHEEHEWRIIHTPMIMGDIKTNETTIHTGISDPKHRVSNNKLITYFEYNFSSLVGSGIICDLVLGPKCEISNYDLDIFLPINGLEKLKYRRSAASYR
jgi:hypothetical protein